MFIQLTDMFIFPSFWAVHSVQRNNPDEFDTVGQGIIINELPQVFGIFSGDGAVFQHRDKGSQDGYRIPCVNNWTHDDTEEKRVAEAWRLFGRVIAVALMSDVWPTWLHPFLLVEMVDGTEAPLPEDIFKEVCTEDEAWVLEVASVAMEGNSFNYIVNKIK